VTSFTRASFLQFVRVQGQLSKKMAPVSQILIPSETLPNPGTTMSSCITSSLIMQSASSTQAFFHVFAAIRCKQLNGGHQMKGILPEYQIISIYINRLTYRQILYQALAKLSETIDISKLVADNEISVALTDKKEPGVSQLIQLVQKLMMSVFPFHHHIFCTSSIWLLLREMHSQYLFHLKDLSLLYLKSFLTQLISQTTSATGSIISSLICMCSMVSQ